MHPQVAELERAGAARQSREAALDDEAAALRAALAAHAVETAMRDQAASQLVRVAGLCRDLLERVAYVRWARA